MQSCCCNVLRSSGRLQSDVFDVDHTRRPWDGPYGHQKVSFYIIRLHRHAMFAEAFCMLPGCTSLKGACTDLVEKGKGFRYFPLAWSTGMMERLLGAGCDLPCLSPAAVEARVLDPRLAAWMHSPDLVRPAPRSFCRWRASVPALRMVDVDADVVASRDGGLQCLLWMGLVSQENFC